MTNNDLYIVGAGGFGKEVRSMLGGAGFSFKGFIDDNVSKHQSAQTIDQFCLENQHTSTSVVIAIGSSKVRKAIYGRLISSLHFPAIIHPSVIFQDSETCKFEQGAVICAGSILTCDISIGKFALINLNCTIGHDVKMGDFCSLMPAVNLSGNVTLEEGVFIGTGATVLQGITIGKGAIVAAGALVNQDVAPGQTVVGVPARILPLG